MVRSRLACVALALGLGLLGGCSWCCRHPLARGSAAGPDCGCGAGEAFSEGAVAGDTLPPGLTPPNGAMIVNPPLEAGPQPRLVPQPQTQAPAPIAPYIPR